jgi:hypothetical protein
VQTLADTHDTPANSYAVVALRTGVGWTDHRMPFQRTTSGVQHTVYPTAVHAFAEVQETLVNSLPSATRGRC